jgi:hypothetical protein
MDITSGVGKREEGGRSNEGEEGEEMAMKERKERRWAMNGRREERKW